ncbi:prolipoprotein diacylglyceryl transferase [Pseudodesulfovibrio senegalensis]|uniref:Phosphatidylglycerol--prolipoprotein diacylglyceryl transferase n=1 Tax=Pseudodesulfovibrio senegalensis TaxID=1721087 RepID=A0A6N6N159_9BACT|nr:prolipoprotein diacylglyceryl transferase [Pseudodesulfovibrio senegalensis]KAB1441112.1 prolipoprotein diacylglyceryl transferase [Pseudodesulfovibrio senegalensis]
MQPLLLEIGPVAIYAYGVFVAAAFLAGMGWTMHEAGLRGLDKTRVPALGLSIIAGGILGARLLYICIDPQRFINDPLEIPAIWNGGLVFSGGLAGGVLAGWLTLRKQPHKMQWADAMAPGLALGQCIGRIGCLMAGCCYGSMCTLPWAITFTNPQSLAPLYRPLHPTQLYHSLSGLLTFLILIMVRKRLKRPGDATGLFLVLFSVQRFVIEFFRADYRGEIGMFSATQVVTGVFCLLGLILLLKNHARSKRNV